MKELGLQELLRYALSGGICMAALLLTYPAVACSVSRMDATKEATLLLGSVLLIGTLIYNIHRAVVFPVFLRLLGFIALGWKFSWAGLFWPLKPSEPELEIDHWRWSYPPDKRKRWDEWGAQTHSLYCAAWGMFAALLFRSVCEETDHRAWHILSILFGVTLISGIANNYRLLHSLAVEMKRAPGGYTPEKST
jgi:hypothetical protein